ncbi:MAG TPA: BolA family protein [Micavibrio sp.]
MKVAEQIENILRQALKPVEIQVLDQSHLHEGHAGARPGGQTHFQVTVISPLFAGKTRLECHRMINELLADLLQNQVHALAINASPPK